MRQPPVILKIGWAVLFVFCFMLSPGFCEKTEPVAVSSGTISHPVPEKTSHKVPEKISPSPEKQGSPGPEEMSLGREKIPSLMESIRFKGPITFCGTRIPIEDIEVRQRLEMEMLLMLWDRAQVILWIKRSGRYFPHVEAILAQEGLPMDLKYITVIESSLRPHAQSSAGAVGLWQFMKSTGRRYGLTINSRVDERRNLFKSTRAACQYLKKLYAQFGSYLLAMSAYNMGESGLQGEIDSQDTRDYFSLYLYRETQRYVFRAVAVKLILDNPAAYGFDYIESDLYPPLTFSEIEVNTSKDVPILNIAKAAGVSFKTIKDMNPEIRGYILGPGKTQLLVPKGADKGFKEEFAKLCQAGETKQSTRQTSRIHVVRPGESLGGIARKYGMSLSALLKLNHFGKKKVIHPGDRLVIRY